MKFIFDKVVTTSSQSYAKQLLSVYILMFEIMQGNDAMQGKIEEQIKDEKLKLDFMSSLKNMKAVKSKISEEVLETSIA